MKRSLFVQKRSAYYFYKKGVPTICKKIGTPSFEKRWIDMNLQNLQRSYYFQKLRMQVSIVLYRR